jgi:hypothetical protein
MYTCNTDAPECLRAAGEKRGQGRRERTEAMLVVIVKVEEKVGVGVGYAGEVRGATGRRKMRNWYLPCHEELRCPISGPSRG